MNFILMSVARQYFSYLLVTVYDFSNNQRYLPFPWKGFGSLAFLPDKPVALLISPLLPRFMFTDIRTRNIAIVFTPTYPQIHPLSIRYRYFYSLAHPHITITANHVPSRKRRRKEAQEGFRDCKVDFKKTTDARRTETSEGPRPKPRGGPNPGRSLESRPTQVILSIGTSHPCQFNLWLR